MDNRELIKKLKDIKTGQPNQEWVSQNRELLLSQIKAQQSSRLEIFSKDGAQLTWQVTKMFFPQKLAYRVATAIVLVVILVLGSSVTTVWADRSLPGDILYPLKITTEKVQLTFTSGEEAKAKLKVEFAGKRLEEIRQINNNRDQSPEARSKKIEKTLKSYKKNIEEVDDHLAGLEQTAEAQELVDMASLVNDQLGEYSATLTEEKEKVDVVSSEKKTIEEMINTSEQATERAFNIIVEKQQNGEVTISLPEFKKIIKQEVDRIRVKAKGLFSQLTAIEKEEGVKKEITESKNKLVEVDIKLTEIGRLLEQGDTDFALDKLKEATQMTKEAEAVVKELTTSDQEEPVQEETDLEGVADQDQEVIVEGEAVDKEEVNQDNPEDESATDQEEQSEDN